MSKVICTDPDEQVSAMCHRNHVERAYLYEESIPDAAFEPVYEKPKSGPVIHIFKSGTCAKGRRKIPTIKLVRRILGALARAGAGIVFLCGVADGLIDTTYGAMLTIICIGWGLLHLLKVVAHG